MSTWRPAGRRWCRATRRRHNGEDVNTTNICPAALGTKDQQPAAFSPKTGLFYVPTNHVCMDYEPYKVSYTAGQPYVGATARHVPGAGRHDLGNFIAWDASEGKIVWSIPEPFSVWSGALATAGDVVFYGTLEGYLKAVDAETGSRALPLQDPVRASSATSTPGCTRASSMSACCRASAAGPASASRRVSCTGHAQAWHNAAGRGGEGDQLDTAGLGAVGAYKSLSNYTQLGGQLTVFKLGQLSRAIADFVEWGPGAVRRRAFPLSSAPLHGVGDAAWLSGVRRDRARCAPATAPSAWPSSDRARQHQSGADSAGRAARIAMLREAVSRRMADAGLELVDAAPVAAEVAGLSSLRGCNGCEVALGRKLGADFVVDRLGAEGQQPDPQSQPSGP